MTVETAGPLEDNVRAGVAPWLEVRRSRRGPDTRWRQAERTRQLTTLLFERPDLEGVHAPADFAAESLRWCV